MNDTIANRYGPIRQLAYVARDIPAVMQHFIGLGIGPWYHGKDVELFDFDYRGSGVQPDLEFAIAPWGGLQLELLCQKDDTPSILRPWMQRPFAQMLQHHVAIWPDDYDATVALALSDGYVVQQRANTVVGRFCYLINPDQPEFVLEITEQSPMRREFGGYIHASQNDWNRDTAIRGFGPPQ
ncbi:MAG: glyoxalase [Bradyrhizobium sp.]|nr:glyoxalase [Bradyrhizobium sp.]